ncbi:MAG: DUF1648 domain-containing protein [Pirellulaceae bacterium]
MINRRWQWIVGTIAFWILIALLQNAWYYPRLPEKVAIHFNAAGKADSWASKSHAMLLMIGLQTFLPAFLLLISQLTRSLPTECINLPHREYWLAPERKEATLKSMERFLWWIAMATCLWILVVNHLTFVANVSEENLRLLPFFAGLAIYMAIVFCLAGGLVWKFRLPSSCPPNLTLHQDKRKVK